MYSLLENTFISKELYQTILAPVCEKYALTQAEMVVLLFLANNPQLDTATDIVEKRRLTKSAVSMAGRTLQEKGLIHGGYAGGNHRSIHLQICDKALPIIEEGKQAQNKFLDILTRGFTAAEQTTLRSYILRMIDNIRSFTWSAG